MTLPEKERDRIFVDAIQRERERRSKYDAEIGDLRNLVLQKTPAAQKAADKLLDSDDPVARYSALVAIAFDIGHTDRGERLLSILDQDEDADCRRGAAMAVGRIWHNTSDRGILNQLKRIARDTREDADVRVASYFAIFVVRGVPSSEIPDTLTLRPADFNLLVIANDEN